MLQGFVVEGVRFGMVRASGSEVQVQEIGHLEGTTSTTNLSNF